MFEPSVIVIMKQTRIIYECNGPTKLHWTVLLWHLAPLAPIPADLNKTMTRAYQVASVEFRADMVLFDNPLLILHVFLGKTSRVPWFHSASPTSAVLKRASHGPWPPLELRCRTADGPRGPSSARRRWSGSQPRFPSSHPKGSTSNTVEALYQLSMVVCWNRVTPKS